jgi:hypothetical protein
MTITSVRRFIVSIYRATRNRPDRLLGVIEDVDKGEERVFRNMEDLWAILSAHKGKIRKSDRRDNGEIEH